MELLSVNQSFLTPLEEGWLGGSYWNNTAKTTRIKKTGSQGCTIFKYYSKYSNNSYHYDHRWVKSKIFGEGNPLLWTNADCVRVLVCKKLSVIRPLHVSRPFENMENWHIVLMLRPLKSVCPTSNLLCLFRRDNICNLSTTLTALNKLPSHSVI